MNDDNFDPEMAAVTVFSYLIRGLSNESISSPNDQKRKAVKDELIQKMAPMKRLYAMSDEVFPVYVEFCIRNRKFMKIPETIEVFGEAITSGKVSSAEEKIMMQWITEIMRTNKTTGNVKTKRR